MTYRICKPPSQSVYSGVCHRLAITSKIAIGFCSGVCHRLAITSKIAIGFCSGVRHRLALMSKITIRLTMSRPLIYTIILTNMSYKRKRKTYFGFIHYRKHTLSLD
ncbi:TPA: hypothetical protein V0B54_000584 [Streptococcus pneumoniae]|nr:hypothetical protein [Streptococcus pneumoniae]